MSFDHVIFISFVILVSAYGWFIYLLDATFFLFFVFFFSPTNKTTLTHSHLHFNFIEKKKIRIHNLICYYINSVYHKRILCISYKYFLFYSSGFNKNERCFISESFLSLEDVINVCFHRSQSNHAHRKDSCKTAN